MAALSRETKPAMAFVIGYSADTTRGSNIEIRRVLTPIVDEGRRSEGSYGFYSPEKGNDYQWVFRIFQVLDSEKIGTPEEKSQILSSLFWETLLTPKSLYEHLSHHTLRELRFMLFDSSPNSNSVADPEGYHFFVKRDGANLNTAQVRSNYATNEPVLGLPWYITKAAKRIAKKYKAEYQRKPGMMRVYAVLSLALLVFLLYQMLGVGRYVKRATRWIRKDPQIRYTGGLTALQGIHPAANGIALLIYGIWAGNAIMACFLIYALHRYSYYVLPFIAFTAIYGLYLLYKILRSRGQQSAPPKPSKSDGI